MNKHIKINNPVKIITDPDTRWSYANLWEPRSSNGGTPKYGTKRVANIKVAIEIAYKEGEANDESNSASNEDDDFLD